MHMTTTLTLKKHDRLLVLAVHPDDETLGAAGLIQHAVAAGAAVKIIFVTNGDKNPWPQRALELHWRITDKDRARWGDRRSQEAIAAISTFGLHEHDAKFLGLPDQGLSAMLKNGNQQLIEQFSTLIGDFQPTVLVSSAIQDKHPDHNALAVIIDFALTQLNTPPPLLLTYLIHGQQAGTGKAYSIALAQEELDCKRRAILCHATQVALSGRRFLRYARSEEIFYRPPPVDHYQPFHPIDVAVTNKQTLHLSIRLQGLMRWLGMPNLYLLGEHGGHHIRLRLALNPGWADIYDCLSNTSISQVYIDNDLRRVETEIPMELFGGCESIYLKLDRRGSFFDMAGWRQAPLKLAEPRRVLDTIAVMPCYDVADFCEQVIVQTIHYVDHLIVIDDGSSDATGQILSRFARLLPDRLSLISFPYNRGKGVGLTAGFCHALNHFDFKTLVTLDADGQHPPKEIPSLVQAIAAGADMAIGGRQLEKMPGRSRLGNTLVTGALKWFYPHAPKDTQSGLRAFTQGFVQEIVSTVPGSRYETEFQILLLALSQQRSIVSTSIPTIYIDNNRSSKFRPVTDSLRIMHALIRWRLSKS